MVWTEPKIIEVDNNGEVTLHQNFAAIGTGSIIAKSTLYQREQSSFRSVEETLYHLYEATRLAQKSAPSVGEMDYFTVVDPSPSEGELLGMSIVKPSRLKVLEETFDAISMKPLVEPPALGEDWLMPVNVEPPESKAKSPSKRKKSKGQP